METTTSGAVTPISTTKCLRGTLVSGMLGQNIVFSGWFYTVNVYKSNILMLTRRSPAVQAREQLRMELQRVNQEINQQTQSRMEVKSFAHS